MGRMGCMWMGSRRRWDAEDSCGPLLLVVAVMTVVVTLSDAIRQSIHRHRNAAGAPQRRSNGRVDGRGISSGRCFWTWTW